MKLKVRVTREHIKNGKPENANFCPIALAVRELGYKRVRVESTEIITRNKSFTLPNEASDFIEDFDYGDKVRPFTFVAELQ